MKLPEYRAKELLARQGIAVPLGEVVVSAAGAADAARRLGPVAVKAQVLAGGRGRAGAVQLVATPEQAADAAAAILGSTVGDELVASLLVEEAVDVQREVYVALSVDTSAREIVLVYAAAGGIAIEDEPDRIERHALPIGAVANELPELAGVPHDVLRRLHRTFVDYDAILVEVNPLVITTSGDVIAVDAKIELDDAALSRSDVRHTPAAAGTELERRAATAGLRLVELGGNIAILANGAGLTMATMDAVVAAGGRPANFLEIGGDAYTKAVPALEIALAQRGVDRLLVNFCGAFARCDVMAEGVVAAWEQLQPALPVVFSIHGTGQDEARALVEDRLGVEPFETMADAVAAVVGANP